MYTHNIIYKSRTFKLHTYLYKTTLTYVYNITCTYLYIRKTFRACVGRLYFIRAWLYYIQSQFSRLSFKSIKRSAADGDGRPVAFETAPGTDDDEIGVKSKNLFPPAEVKTRKSRVGFERPFNEPMGKISPAVPPDYRRWE